MSKARTLEKKKTKNQNMGVKDGLVAKKKNQKMKGTPIGKMNVVNKKNNQNGKKADGSPKSTGKKNKEIFNKDNLKVKNEELESDDEDFDSENDNESVEDSDGQSDNDKSVERKGVNMFNGIKAEEDYSDDEECEVEDDDSEDEEDHSDDDDEEDELDESTGLKALLGESIGDDDDDDDFNENDALSEDDDLSEEDEEVVKEVNSKLGGMESSSDDKEEDDDEDEDDEEDEDHDKDESIGLQALLGESLDDDDDDMDFEEDDEDDDDDDGDDDDDDDSVESDEGDEKDQSAEKSMTPMKKSKKEEPILKSPILSPEQQEELQARTIYVGNVPKDTTQKDIKKLFKSCGEIKTIRIRGVVPEDSRMSPKVATITKKMHPKVQSIYAYVEFKDESSVKEALKINGQKLGDNILRVDLSKTQKHDGKKAVFIGNLPLEITDDEVRNHFVSCGKIESIRLIKDRRSGLGKGVGYVNFVSEDSVALALELNGTTLNKREIRVKNYTPGKTKKRNRDKSQKQNRPNESRKKFKDNKGKAVAVHEQSGKGSKKKRKRSQGEVKREKSTESQSSSQLKNSFQGQTADIQKKSKDSKLNKKKKIMAEKLTSSKKTD